MSDFTDEVQNVEAEAISEARKARKEAQALVAEVQYDIEHLRDLITGKSGLTAEGKAEVLAAAKAKAAEIAEKTTAITTKLEDAHTAATS